MISVDQALAIIDVHRLTLPPESVPLADAVDRVLTEDLRARLDVPPSAVSSMDGYAVRSGDLASGGEGFAIIGEAPAGKPFGGTVQPGQTVRVFTGAHVPDGADQVVMQENAQVSGEMVTLMDSASPGRFIRGAGIDFQAGAVLLPAGHMIRPVDIALGAAADHAALNVAAKPRIAILANGNELRAPGSANEPGSVVASNAYGLAALIHRWGGEVIDLGIADDSVDAICAAITRAGDADIIVPVGGASVGDYDFMQAAFAQLGLTRKIDKIAVRPGKPTWFGTLDRRLVLGLPGNPASAFACAHLFLRPLMAGRDALRFQEAVAAHDIGAEGPRTAFLRASKTDTAGAVRLLPDQDSSLLRPFAAADYLLRRDANAPAIKAGERVTVLPIQH